MRGQVGQPTEEGIAHCASRGFALVLPYLVLLIGNRMAHAPRTPKHTPQPGFELCWHSTCGHISWRPLATLPPEAGASPGVAKPPSRYLQVGSYLCPTCEIAQATPTCKQARLLCSIYLQRIVAIGFGFGRKDELKALGFSWVAARKVWIYEPTKGGLESLLPTLAKPLACLTEILDTRDSPPFRKKEEGPAPANKTELAIITCLLPGRFLTRLAGESLSLPIIASIPWPPSLEDLRNISTSDIPPEVVRVLCLPSLPELLELGFTREDLFHIVEGSAGMDISICTADLAIDLRGLAPSIKAIQALKNSPSGANAPRPLPDRHNSKGGRPATARQKAPEVIRLKAEGWTIAQIQAQLLLSRRSIGRILRDLEQVS